jgi:hypothetical protein
MLSVLLNGQFQTHNSETPPLLRDIMKYSENLVCIVYIIFTAIINTVVGFRAVGTAILEVTVYN